MKNFNWWKTFASPCIESKVDLLNEALLNILRSYIPNKKIKFIVTLQPPWMTDSIKGHLKERSILAKSYYKKGQEKSDHEK